MSHYRVEWTVTARDDLTAVIVFIAQSDQINAEKVLQAIEDRATTLVTHPERGRIVPELQHHNVNLYRELIEGPWRLVYRVDGRAVYVMAVLDGRRRLEDLLLDRFLRG